MIQDDIINELQYIPESKLIELYDLIHYFRLGLNSEAAKQSPQNEGLGIEKAMCLSTLKKIKQDNLSSFSEIDDVDAHIKKPKQTLLLTDIINDLPELPTFNSKPLTIQQNLRNEWN